MLDNNFFYNWMFNEEKLKEEREVKWKKIVGKGMKMQQILASVPLQNG